VAKYRLGSSTSSNLPAQAQSAGVQNLSPGCGKEFMRKLHAGYVSEENAMAMERPLGLPRRAGGVDDEGGIFARGINRCEIRRGLFDRRLEIRVGAVFALHDEDVAKLRQG
jgi:hypothetical protein